MTKTVPLDLGSFSDDAGILDMTTDEVVAYFMDKEKNRHRLARDDENQQEDVVGSRVAPAGLIMSLDAYTRRLGVSRSILTRCLSHQLMAWMESVPRSRELVDLFSAAHDAANEYGYPDLYEDMRPNYMFANTSPRNITFRTIRWVKNGLSSMSTSLGVPVGVLFVIGLCYSLSRTSSPQAKGTIEKYLAVEVSRFQQHVEEQFIRVFRFHDLVRQRATKDGYH